MWVEGTCGWREHVGGGNMWVEGTCGWREHVGGENVV